MHKGSFLHYSSLRLDLFNIFNSLSLAVRALICYSRTVSRTSGWTISGIRFEVPASDMHNLSYNSEIHNFWHKMLKLIVFWFPRIHSWIIPRYTVKIIYRNSLVILKFSIGTVYSSLNFSMLLKLFLLLKNFY